MQGVTILSEQVVYEVVDKEGLIYTVKEREVE